MRQQVTTNMFKGGAEEQFPFRTTRDASANSQTQPVPTSRRSVTWVGSARVGATGLKAIAILALAIASPILRGQTSLAQQQQALEDSIKLQQQELQRLNQSQAAAKPGPKKPGVVRVGIVSPKSQMPNTSGMINISEPVREGLIHYIDGPLVEAIPLSAGIAVQYEAEASQKDCDYILTSTVTAKKGGGGGFVRLLASAGPAASLMPMLGMAGGVSGAIAGATASTAVSALASTSSFVHAKDEVTSEYHVFSVSGQNDQPSNTLKSKAKEDGEDVLTPLIEQASTSIVTSLVKK
jgi:hypothetical protein